jgi:uncharacterized membrane protein
MTPRALTIALLGSLAVNLFAGGALVGILVAGARPAPVQERPVGPAALWRAGDALPPDDRQAYRELLRTQSMEVRQQVRQSRLARREAFESLGSEPVDAQVVRGRLDEARRLEMQARGQVEGALVDFASRLPPPERAELARGLTEFAPGPRPGMRRFQGPPPGGPDAP